MMYNRNGITPITAASALCSILLIPLSMPACEAPSEPQTEKTQWVPLHPDNRQNIDMTRLVVTYDDDWAHGEGERAAEIEDLVEKFNLPQVYVLQISAQVAPIRWLYASALEAKNLQETSIEQLIKTTSTSHFLHLDFAFDFSDDYSELALRADNTLYSLKEDDPSIVYSNSFIFLEFAPTRGESDADLVDYWLREHGNRLFDIFQEGMIELARMSAVDLEHGAVADGDAERIEIQGVSGKVLQESGDRVWIRKDSGTVYSFPKDHPD